MGGGDTKPSPRADEVRPEQDEDRPEQDAIVGGRYRLVRALGSGGMGMVWSARHVVTNRLVALKFVQAHRAQEVTVARVVREARAASAVEHANLCAVHDVIELPTGAAVLVMDHLEGHTLRALLREHGQLGVEEAASFFVQVASALGAAHAAGVLHRDIKPENLFRERHGRARVLDFGIAKLEEAGDLETDSSNAGTPPYMAPEQLLGDKRFDPRVDVWSLGVVLYESLTGTCPTTAGAENAGQVLRNVIERPIAPLKQVAPDVPDRVASLVDRMLARDPRARCAGMDEVLEALRPWSKIVVAETAGSLPPETPKSRGEKDAAGTATLPSPGVGRAAAADSARSETAATTSSPAVKIASTSRRPWVAGGMMVAILSLAWLGLREPEHRSSAAGVGDERSAERAPTSTLTVAAPPPSSPPARVAEEPAPAPLGAGADDLAPTGTTPSASAPPRKPTSAPRPRERPRTPGTALPSSPRASASGRAPGPLDEPW
jgi:serine/threonine protein kinase